MLNNFEIRDTISIYQWFDRTVNLHIRHQQALDKWGEKKWKVAQMRVWPVRKQMSGAD